MPRFRRSVWLFPVVFLAHVVEEAPRFSAWARRHGSVNYARSDFIRDNSAGLGMTLLGTRLVSRNQTRPVVFGYFALVLSQQALFNALFHSGTTIAYREYSPGLATALGGFLPLWWHLTRLARREELISGSGSLLAAGIGAVIHLTAVAQQVYRR